MKTALIVIEGTETLKKIAEELSVAFHGYQTTIRQAESFSGIDILPANVFFLGCEKPGPDSFSYLGKLLQHINLSGRSCGVFSTDNKALKYLSKLTEACGASSGKPLLIKNISDASALINNWIQTIPLSNF
jgi:hypothetical protein